MSSTYWTVAKPRRVTDSICAPIAFAQTATTCSSQPSVVFASEPMDDDPRWRLLEPGELVHVDSALQITSDVVLPDPPRHQLGPADLNATAQAAQHTAASSVTAKRALVLGGGDWRESLGRRAFCGASPTSRPTAAQALAEFRCAAGHLGRFDGRRADQQWPSLADLFERQVAGRVSRNRSRRRHRRHRRPFPGRAARPGHHGGPEAPADRRGRAVRPKPSPSRCAAT